MPISDRIKPKKVNEPVTTNQDELNGFIDFDDDLPIIVGQLTPNDLNLGGILTIGEKGADGYSPWVEFKPIESSESSENLPGNKVIIHYHDDYGIERKVEFDVLDGNGISSITQEEDSEGYYHLHIILDNGTEITTDRISGLSAYEVGVNNGFIGTEEEWLASLKGEKGDTGPYFTPEVDSEGNISWTNNGDLPNPETQNITGPQGEQGEQGPQGEVGPYYIPSVDKDGNITWEATSSELPIPEATNIKGGIYVPTLSSEGITWIYYSDTENSETPDNIPLELITGPQGKYYLPQKVNIGTGYAIIWQEKDWDESGETPVIDLNDLKGDPGVFYQPSWDGDKIVFTQTTASQTAPPIIDDGPNLTGPKGDKGDKGKYYYPELDSEGILHWTIIDNGSSDLPAPSDQDLIGPQGPQGETGETGGHYIPQVIETSQGKFIVWEWTPESSETSETPTDINLEELRGPKGDKGDQGPVGSTITSIEPVESSSGATFGVYGTDHDSSDEKLINTFEFDLGQIIWDCGTSTEVIGPDWGDNYIPEV